VLYMRDLENRYGENADKTAGKQPAAKPQPNLGTAQYQEYQPGVMVSGRNPIVPGHKAASLALASEPEIFQPGLNESGTTAWVPSAARLRCGDRPLPQCSTRLPDRLALSR
jgi:hypothetical protein